jgi:hypothetical protein
LADELWAAVATKRIGTVKSTMIFHRRARALEDNEQQQSQPFHGRMQTKLGIGVKRLLSAKADCMMSILRGWFGSVRSCGLRTNEPRQGRNAATVV